MLLRALLSGNLSYALVMLLLMLPAVVLCLVVHEMAHGLAAYALGDRTAKNSGRLTFDPKAHIDPMGFLCLLLLGFGWARPVPVDISHFKNRRVGMGVTALAGPLSNFILAIAAFLVYIALQVHGVTANHAFLQAVAMFCNYVGILSVGLGVFNLIPIYPMDGARILNAILPLSAQMKLDQWIRRYQSILVLLLIFVLWFGGLQILIDPAVNGIYALTVRLYTLLFL